MKNHSQIELATKQALEYCIGSDISNAARLCQEILAKQPNNFDALYILRMICIDVNEDQAADTLHAKIKNIVPNIQDFAYTEATIQRKANYNQLMSLYQLYLNYKRHQQADAFLISYPKCGRTWLRLLLGKILESHFNIKDRDPFELPRLVENIEGAPHIEVSHDDYPHWKPFDKIVTQKKAYQNNRVIFLARDPRDVMVSYYYQYTRRHDKHYAEDHDFNGSISEFIRHPIGGLESLVRFYNVWAENRTKVKDFLLIRYEDLHSDPGDILRKILSFINLQQVSQETVDSAIEFCRFENMRKIEIEDLSDSDRLVNTDKDDPNALKTREGKVGGYVNHLSEEDIAYINHKIAQDLDPFYNCYKTITIPTA